MRNYFGEKIAFYFAFLNFYCKLFLCTSLICLLNYLLGNIFSANELCTVLVCLSLFIFLKLWKRQSFTMAHKWGTIEALELESARPTFKSKGVYNDPITGHPTPFYPIHKTWLREYFISLPCVFFCLYIAFKVMLIYFDVENATLLYYQSYPSTFTNVLTYLPSILYALIVLLMNHSYRILATKLNDYGNICSID